MTAPKSLPFDLRILRLLFRLAPRGHRLVRAVWRRRLKNLGPVRVRTTFGFDIVLDAADHVSWCIIMHGNWEPAVTNLVRRSLASGDVFVDVGANYGWHALAAAAILNGRLGRVVAYEPQEKLCSFLRMSAELNGFGHLSVVQAAVADQASWGAIRLPSANRVELATVCVTGRSADGVEVITLDEEFAGQPSPTVVKIDVEGYELRVLRGMRSLLERGSLRSMFIEVHPPLMANLGDDPGQLLDLLQASGFRVSTVGKNGRLDAVAGPDALVSASAHSGCCNVVAIRG